MTDSFVVRSSLTLTNNVSQVLTQLIEGFERIDKAVKGSQEQLTAFERTLKELGSGKGGIDRLMADLKKLQDLKLNGSLLSDLAKASEFSSNIAKMHSSMRTSAVETAAAWREIAAASSRIKTPGGPPGPGGGGGSGGGGRGGGRGGGPGGNPLFGQGDDWANGRWLNGDFDTRERSQDRAARERERAASRRYADDFALGSFENSSRDRRFSNDYALAQRENRDFDLRQKAQSGKKMSHFELGHAAVGMQMAGDVGTSFFEKSIMAGFDFEHKFAILTGDMRVTEEQQVELRKQLQEVTRQVPGSTLGGNLEVFNDLKNAFGDFGEAKEELKSFSKLVTVLQMADLRHGGDGNMNQALAMARFIEDQGGAIDLKDPTKYDKGRFDEIANRAVSIAVATQMRVTPREMLAFQKSGRTGGMMMNDHALYEETPYFAASLGASRLGTAIFSDMQVMLAGRLDKAHATELESLGLLGPGHMQGKGRSARYVYDRNSLKDRELLASDPYRWIHDVLGEAVAKKIHADPTTEEGKNAILLEMTAAAQRGTIAGLWGDVFRNFGPAQKEGRNISAQNPDMLGHLMGKDPMAQLMVFHAAQNEFMVTLGELLKGPAVEYLKQFTAALHELVDTINKHPDAAAEIAKIALEVSVFLKVMGGLAMAAFFLGPVATLLTKVAGVFRLFMIGGTALAGLTGLTSGVTALAAKLSASSLGAGAAAAGGAGLAGGAAIGVGILGAGAGGFVLGKKYAEDQEAGRIPMLVDPETGWPMVYKNAAPDTHSLVSPPSGSTLGTSTNPVVVHVDNQVTGSEIATGVSSNLASKMNRPQTGMTGSDLRMNLSPAYQGALGGTIP